MFSFLLLNFLEWGRERYIRISKPISSFTRKKTIRLGNPDIPLQRMGGIRCNELSSLKNTCLLSIYSTCRRSVCCPIGTISPIFNVVVGFDDFPTINS